MVRAVVDTNVLIRYLIRPSVAIRVLIEDLWIDGYFQMVTSPALLSELAEVMARPRIRKLIHPADAAELLSILQVLAEPITLPRTIPEYTRDRKDDKFVACALAAGANYLVTVDQDILVLASLNETKMVTPADFVAALSPQ